LSGATYDAIGAGYARRRQADPRIAAQIHAALGDARSVVNVGAGTGSYEPADRLVQAVEPSATMISQRPTGAAPCVRAAAEALPFANGSFDAAMAILTIHHWSDWRAGVRELRRVARRRILILTFDVEASDFWLMRDYFPDLLALDRQIMPPLAALRDELGQDVQASAVPVPFDCKDGFLGAYWRRPEVYLDPVARRSMSSFARIDAAAGLDRLARELESGEWRARYGELLARNALDIGYRLVRWDAPSG
jgi:SAM-dependent methyltransferase